MCRALYRLESDRYIFAVGLNDLYLANSVSFMARKVSGGRWYEMVSRVPITVSFAVMPLI
jgi:hypothetical protein